MVARGAGAAGPVLLACRQWDPLGLAQRLPSLGVGAWRSAPLLPWQVQCPVRVCAALAVRSGGSGRYLVLCLSRFPLPAPRVPRCVWRAVPSGCPLSSLAGTPFHTVCAFRELGPVALLVVPAYPLRVCALALPRRPLLPPLGGVACAPRAVPALGAGRAVPLGPCPSACPAPVPCSVWSALGGAVWSRFPPTWLGAVHPPWGGSVAFVCRGAGRGGGGRAPCPPFVRPGKPVGRGVALPRSVPLPPLGWQRSRCHWRRSGHGGLGPHTAPVRARPPSLGAICAASWRIGVGSLGARGSCGSRRLGRGGRPCSGSSLGQGEGGPSPLPWGGGGRRPRGLRAGGGDGGGGGGVAPLPPCSPSGGRPAAPYPGPPLVVGALPPGVRFRSGLRGRPRGGGTRGGPWTAPPGAPSDLNPPSTLPEWAMVMGWVMGGAAPILFWCAAVCRLQAWSARRSGALVWACPSAATPAGAGGWGRWGARCAGPAAPPPPPPRVAVLSWGGGASPRLRGGGGSLLWPSSWGGERGGGAGGSLRRPPPPRPVGRRPAVRCLWRAFPWYTRAVGVAGRPWASGAARSAANGSVRRGGEGVGGNPPALARATAFPRPASEGAAPFAPSWAPPVRRRSAAGRAGACGRFTGGACRGRGAPSPRVQRPLPGGCGAAVSSVCLRPLLGLRGRGGGSGGGPLVPWRRPLTAEGGRPGGPGPGGQPSAGGSHSSPAPLYLEPDPRAGPRWGPLSPPPSPRGAGRPGAAVRVSGQRLAGCGAVGSPPRSLSPPSLPWEVARAPPSRRIVEIFWDEL